MGRNQTFAYVVHDNGNANVKTIFDNWLDLIKTLNRTTTDVEPWKVRSTVETPSGFSDNQNSKFDCTINIVVIAEGGGEQNDNYPAVGKNIVFVLNDQTLNGFAQNYKDYVYYNLPPFEFEDVIITSISVVAHD